MEKILTVRNLSKTFNGVRAVNNISFSVAKGEIVGLLGPNGAGKTTTIQMILGLIKPTRGTITVFGKNLETHRMEILSEVNFSSAYISLPGNLKVWENLYTFARLYGVKNYKKRVEELARFRSSWNWSLPIVPTSTLPIKKFYAPLNRLLNSPKLLFLDEPTSSLDPDIADRVRKLLKKIQKEQALTILYTTHNMIEVEELCDRAIFIHQGKIVTEGTPKQLIKRFGLKDLNEVFIKIARKS